MTYWYFKSPKPNSRHVRKSDKHGMRVAFNSWYDIDKRFPQWADCVGTSAFVEKNNK